MATSIIKHDTPILFKQLTRDNISHPAGGNYWSMEDFPPKAGYSRRVGSFSTNNANVVITGYYFNNNTLLLRTVNTASTTASVSLTCTAYYIRDDLAW